MTVRKTVMPTTNAFRFVTLICLTLSIGCANEPVDSDHSSSELTDPQAQSTEVGTNFSDSPNANVDEPAQETTNPAFNQVSDNDFQPAEKSSLPAFVNSLRVWHDLSQNFSTNAEMVAVGMKSREVQLLKENGVTITVAYDHLSKHDQHFVAAFINNQRQRANLASPKLVDSFE